MRRDLRWNTSGSRIISTEIAGSDGIPAPLPLENQVAELAHRPPAASVAGNEMGVGQHVLHRVRRRRGTTDPAHYRNIDDVVPHEGHLGVVQTGRRENL